MFRIFLGTGFSRNLRLKLPHLRRTGQIVLPLASGLIAYQAIRPPIIDNEVLQAIDTSIHELKPNLNADTYEMGLYESSNEEVLRQNASYRFSKTHSGNWLLRLLWYGKFKFDDYVVDPLVTFGRFLELSAIFVPLILAYPICWFGKKDKGVRSGAKWWYSFLRYSAELAGASFIKLGQWAASRTDIFSQAMCDELSQLHSNAKAHSLKATKTIVSESFGGMSFDQIFDSFDETPVGVGAIAQVYIGTLSPAAIEKARKSEASEVVNDPHPDQFINSILVTEQQDPLKANQRVAIKVIHPNVDVTINRDLKIMAFFAKCIDIIPTMEWLSLPDEVEQFSIMMRLQLDLRIEALNLAKFRQNFRKRLDLHFPKPYLKFTTRDVLVEEYIEAIPLQKFLDLKDNTGKNLSKEISDKGLDAFLQMLILDNFVHADLHPGNMLIRFYKNKLYPHAKEYKVVKTSNDSDSNKITEKLMSLPQDQWSATLQKLYDNGYHAEICFLDAGLVTELKADDRRNFIDLFKALAEFDGYKAGELMIERSRTPDTVINKDVFCLKVERLVDRMKQRTFTLGSISIGDLLDQVLGMVRGHHVRMEGDFVTMVVAILLLEGIGRQLDPDLDLFASALPVLRKLGVSKEGREMFKDEDTMSMIKVWLGLEMRQFINASVQDIHQLVKADMLSPNV